MKCTPEKNDPFSFEGPEIYKCKVMLLLFLILVIDIDHNTKIRTSFI